MLVRLSIIGAFAAILMLPTTLSAQVHLECVSSNCPEGGVSGARWGQPVGAR